MKSPETKMLGLAFLIAGLVLCGIGVSWLSRPPQFKATARIQVETGFDENGQADASFDPYFIQTTFEIMQSEVVLSNVVASLDLNHEWGVKYNRGAPLKLSETLKILKGKLILEPVPNTKLITITFFSDDPKDAANIANAIADSYKNYREESHRQLMIAGMKSLEEGYQTEEKKIQTLQTNVDELRKKLRIKDSLDSTTITQSEAADQVQAERDYLQSSNQLAKLKTDDANQLRADLPLVVHDAALMDLLKKLSETEQAYESLTDNYLPTNTEVIQTQTSLNTLNQQIDDRVAGLMAGLESELNSKKAALDSIRQLRDKNAEEHDPKNQPYYDAKIQLDQQQDQLRLIRAKIDAIKMGAGIISDSTPQIVDLAEPPKFPAGPNRFLGAILLTIGLISTLSGGLLLKSARQQ